MAISVLAILLAADLIHISDTHVSNLEGVHPALAKLRASNASSLGHFEKFIDRVNQEADVTIVHTGDIVDATCFDGVAGGKSVGGQIGLVARAVEKLKHPIHFALGNHDVECYRYDPAQPAKPVGDQTVAHEARREWGGRVKALRRRSYYSVPLAHGYRLVLVDNGQSFDVADGRAFFEKQMRWLRRDLRKHRRERAILALHIPVGDDARSRLLKDEMAKAGNVALVLCGHRHTDDFNPVTLSDGKQVPQLRTAAMFKGPQTWRRIRITGEGLQISATGEPERIIATLR